MYQRHLKKVYIPSSYEEKQMQRALLQYTRPENAEIIRKALTLAGRKDLIGFGKECLVKPGYDKKYRSEKNVKYQKRGKK